MASGGSSGGNRSKTGSARQRRQTYASRMARLKAKGPRRVSGRYRKTDSFDLPF